MIKILVICDDKWHPAEVIRRGLAAMGNSEFDFDIVEDAKDILTPKMLEQYPIIMNCKCNAISAANEHAWFDKGVTEVGPNEFREYIEKGGGFLSVHSGNAFFKGDTFGYLELVGNYFVQHPPRCDVEIHITADHPVTNGVEDFHVRDEHYEIALTVDDREPWHVIDKALSALIELVADICKRNGIKKLLWQNDKRLVGQVDKQNMTVHRWFSATACPGDYLLGKHEYIADEVNKRLGVDSPFIPRRQLSRGAVGEDVKTLQTTLNSHGATPKLVVDGSFGTATNTAVRAFQKSHELAVDGSVGALTWGKLLG
ncbi:hypothetical protein FACS1894217_07980 [Clostridia bacterium]|nr:hypothetical protein FACS1894217_07980 [Clostridia bacterium]